MTTENPATPPEPRWPYTEPEEPTQIALPIPEATFGDAISYPSDPTGYPSDSTEYSADSTEYPSDPYPDPAEPIAPVSRPQSSGYEPPAPPAYEPAAPPAYELAAALPTVAATPARTGFGRGLLAGLLLAAVIAATAFGLGRLTASDEEPVAADTPQTTLQASSQVANTDPPPLATVPGANGTLEPVAAAAAAVSPAVVQLDTTAGTGSGVIYSAEGYILTAAHVVGNASNVAVRFADGSSTTGTVLGADDTTDVAVVAIEPGEVPAVAVLAIGANLSVGQTAVAVGSPFRLDQTVTSGIISAVDRIVGENDISMVQTDAAINPGNSGGPLVDLNGHVLGINDVIFTNSGDNAGVGFAISIDLAKIVADQITAGQPVSTALLGVSVAPSPDGDAGGLVTDVGSGTAAEAAGIEVGDLVISIDADPIRDSNDLRAEVITRAPGTEIELVLIREGERITLIAVLGSAGG